MSPDGEVTDLYGSLTTVIEMDPFEFLEKIAALLETRTPEYPRIWEDYCKAVPEPEFAYSEMAAVGALIKSLPEASVLHLANSSVVRYAQLYAVSPTVEVCCNRGTSGIEGSLSTAVGYAAASDKLNFVAIGDLSFFYDMNALWNANIGPQPAHSFYLNNGGGENLSYIAGGLTCRSLRISLSQRFTRLRPKAGRKSGDSFTCVRRTADSWLRL